MCSQQSTMTTGRFGSTAEVATPVYTCLIAVVTSWDASWPTLRAMSCWASGLPELVRLCHSPIRTYFLQICMATCKPS